MRTAKKRFQIGPIAKATGVSIQAIRYYERRGLLAPVLRRDSGYRIYGEEALQKLRFIKNAQELGFPLKEIRSLLRLRGGQSRQRLKRKVATHAAIVKEKIAFLRAIDKALSNLLCACRPGVRGEACPILRNLEIKK